MGRATRNDHAEGAAAREATGSTMRLEWGIGKTTLAAWRSEIR